MENKLTGWSVSPFKTILTHITLIGGLGSMFSSSPTATVIGVVCLIYNYLLVLDVRNDIIEARLKNLESKKDESNGQQTP